MLKSRVESLKVELEERRAEVTAATGSAVCRLVGQSYISSSLRFIVPAVSLPYHDCYLPAVQFSAIWLYLVRRRIFFFKWSTKGFPEFAFSWQVTWVSDMLSYGLRPHAQPRAPALPKGSYACFPA